MMLSATIGGLTKSPELELEKPEAELIADPLAFLVGELGYKPDPRVEAAIHLAIALGGVYGPRIGAIRERRREERARNVTRTSKPDPLAALSGVPAPPPPMAAEPPKGAGAPRELTPEELAINANNGLSVFLDASEG